MTPEHVIDEIEEIRPARARRGGFPTAKKWKLCRNVPDSPKYLTCNADEGDPGAFMNRRVLESDPHSVLEGMIIAAFATGASVYPLSAFLPNRKYSKQEISDLLK